MFGRRKEGNLSYHNQSWACCRYKAQPHMHKNRHDVAGNHKVSPLPAYFNRVTRCLRNPPAMAEIGLVVDPDDSTLYYVTKKWLVTIQLPYRGEMGWISTAYVRQAYVILPIGTTAHRSQLQLLHTRCRGPGAGKPHKTNKCLYKADPYSTQILSPEG